MIPSFEKTVTGLCESIVWEHCHAPSERDGAQCDEVVRFVLSQHARMPDHLRMPLKLVTLLFDLAGLARRGRFFHRQPHSARWQQIESWRASALSPRRDLVRFYESLVLYGWYSSHDD